MVEIYNETIADLLISPGESRHHKLYIQKQGRDVCIPVSTACSVPVCTCTHVGWSGGMSTHECSTHYCFVLHNISMLHMCFVHG